jgi:hypothetical protein
MRALIFLALVVVVLALVGWLSWSNDSGRSSIHIETQEIKEDTQKALDSGAALLERAGEKVGTSNVNESAK